MRKMTITVEGGDEQLRATLMSHIESLISEADPEDDKGRPATVNAVGPIEYHDNKAVLAIEIEVEEEENEGENEEEE